MSTWMLGCGMVRWRLHGASKKKQLHHRNQDINFPKSLSCSGLPTNERTKNLKRTNTENNGPVRGWASGNQKWSGATGNHKTPSRLSTKILNIARNAGPRCFLSSETLRKFIFLTRFVNFPSSQHFMICVSKPEMSWIVLLERYQLEGWTLPASHMEPNGISRALVHVCKFKIQDQCSMTNVMHNDHA